MGVALPYTRTLSPWGGVAFVEAGARERWGVWEEEREKSKKNKSFQKVSWGTQAWAGQRPQTWQPHLIPPDPAAAQEGPDPPAATH